MHNNNNPDSTVNGSSSSKLHYSYYWMCGVWRRFPAKRTLTVELSVAANSASHPGTPPAVLTSTARQQSGNTRTQSHIHRVHSHHFALCKSPLSLQREITDISCFLIFTKSPNSLQRAAIFISCCARVPLVGKTDMKVVPPLNVTSFLLFSCFHNKRGDGNDESDVYAHLFLFSSVLFWKIKYFHLWI